MPIRSSSNRFHSVAGAVVASAAFPVSLLAVSTAFEQDGLPTLGIASVSLFVCWLALAAVYSHWTVYSALSVHVAAPVLTAAVVLAIWTVTDGTQGNETPIEIAMMAAFIGTFLGTFFSFPIAVVTVLIETGHRKSGHLVCWAYLGFLGLLFLHRITFFLES